MGESNAGRRGCSQGGSHAGNNFKINLRVAKGFHLLAGATEVIGSPDSRRTTCRPSAQRDHQENQSLPAGSSFCCSVFPAMCSCALGRDEIQISCDTRSSYRTAPALPETRQSFHGQQNRIGPVRAHQINFIFHTSAPFRLLEEFSQPPSRGFPTGQRVQQLQLAFLIQIMARVGFLVAQFGDHLA